MQDAGAMFIPGSSQNPDQPAYELECYLLCPYSTTKTEDRPVREHLTSCTMQYLPFLDHCKTPEQG